MAGLLTAQAIGRLGRDGECRFTPNGKPLVQWSMAVDVGWGDSKTTQWIRCTLWGERSQKLAQYLVKGSQVYVAGRLSTREWDAQDGSKRFDLCIDVQEIQLLGSKGEKPTEPTKTTEDEVPW